MDIHIPGSWPQDRADFSESFSEQPAQTSEVELGQHQVPHLSRRKRRRTKSSRVNNHITSQHPAREPLSGFSSRIPLKAHARTLSRPHNSTETLPSNSVELGDANDRHIRSKHIGAGSPGHHVIQPPPSSIRTPQSSSYQGGLNDSAYGSLPGDIDNALSEIYIPQSITSYPSHHVPFRERSEQLNYAHDSGYASIGNTGFHTNLLSRISSPSTSAFSKAVTPCQEKSEILSSENQLLQCIYEKRLHRVKRYIAEHGLHECSRKTGHQTLTDGKYQCTSRCGFTTKRKGDWIRHEEIKYPQHFWICVVCSHSDGEPFINHRLDKFKEHIKSVHNGHKSLCLEDGEAIRASKVEYTAEFPRQCGLCKSTFQTWSERIRHIASHFEAGMSMSQRRDTLGSAQECDNSTASSQPDSRRRLTESERNNSQYLSPQLSGKTKNQAVYAINDSYRHLPGQAPETLKPAVAENASESFAFFVKQLDFNQEPASVNRFFQQCDNILQVLRCKFKDKFAFFAFSRALDRLDQATRPLDQQIQRFNPLVPPETFDNEPAGLQSGLYPNSLLPFILHRDSCAPIPHGSHSSATNDLPGRRSDLDCQHSSRQLQNPPENIDLAGLGSHLTQDKIKHAAPSGSSSSPSASRSFRQSSSSNPSQGGTPFSGKRSVGGQKSRSGNDSTPNGPVLIEGNPPEDRELLACPVDKHNLLEGATPETLCCRNGYSAHNMSLIVRHVKPHLKQVGRILEFCSRCQTYVVDEQEWENSHGVFDNVERCPSNPQPRGPRQRNQWKSLYLKIYPEVNRVPDPRCGCDGWELVLQSAQQIAPTNTIQREYQEPGRSRTFKELRPETATSHHNAPGSEVLSDASPMFGGNYFSPDHDHSPIPDASFPADNPNFGIETPPNITEVPAIQAFHGPTPWLGDRWTADAEAAIDAVYHFNADFIKMTDPLSQEDLEWLTQDVRIEFYRYLNLTIPPPPHILVPGGRVNHSFTDEFTTETSRLPPSQQSSTVTWMSSYMYVSGYRRLLRQNADLRGQLAKALQPENLHEHVAAQEPFHDSGKGTTDPANMSDISKEPQQGYNPDPIMIWNNYPPHNA